MLKGLANRASAFFRPEKIDHAIEHASVLAGQFEQIAPSAHWNAINPSIVFLAQHIHGLDIQPADIAAYTNGTKEYPDGKTEEAINQLWQLQDDLQRTFKDHEHFENDKELLRRHPDKAAQRLFVFDHNNETPLYTVYNDWKSKLSHTDFLEGMDNSLSNLQRMIDNRLFLIGSLFDKEQKNLVAVTKSPDDAQRITENKLRFQSMLDELPLIRKDLGLPEQPEKLVLASLHKSEEGFKNDLTNE